MACCRCCSSDNLNCRLRTLKASGAFLIMFGLIFALAGIAVGILPEFYTDLPDVSSEFLLYAYIIPCTGFAAFVTGIGSIYVARTMSDDDCSMRGVSVLALLTIICSLASVGVPAWPLYEDGYFFGIPNRTMIESTSDMYTSFAPLTTLSILTTEDTGITMGGTDAAQTTAMATTMMDVSTDNPIMTSGTGTVGATIAVVGTSSADSTSTPDNTATSMGLEPVSTMGMGNSTVGNTTYTMGPTREPIPYDTWLVVMTPFAIICFFAFVLLLFALLVCCITCCCPERSEIVDDKQLYKQ